MDKLLYIASSGANQDLLATGIRANNLANAQTTGFKAQLEQARAMPAYGEGLPTRVFNMTESPTNNYAGGALQLTGRDLDVAVQGEGWFAVQDPNGNIGYTRDGRFQLGPNGDLTDAHGNLVMGDFGPIVLPTPIANLDIAPNGEISIQPDGAPATALEQIDRLQLVNPAIDELKRSEDGLFRLKSGEEADADNTVRVSKGMLEVSNVNAMEEMLSVIGLQRHYEMQVKMMKKAEELDTRGNTLLRII
jgi:flagellar basal-body rod protein FlgF